LNIYTPPPPPPAPTPAYGAAQMIINMARNKFRADRDFVVDTARAVWQSSGATPADILAELGTNAKQLFQDHAAQVAIVAAIDPSVFAEIQAIIQPVTYHDDGTVTVAD